MLVRTPDVDRLGELILSEGGTIASGPTTARNGNGNQGPA